MNAKQIFGHFSKTNTCFQTFRYFISACTTMALLKLSEDLQLLLTANLEGSAGDVSNENVRI